jgi:sec-independent protein translocase protein TatA
MLEAFRTAPTERCDGHMGPEWIIVGFIAIAVIFGAKRIPDIARNVGKAQGEFKKGLREGTTDTGDQPSHPAAKPPDQPPAES